MTNLPCRGCFWTEGGKCFNDKLAHVHGLETAPRGHTIGSGLNGLKPDDALIAACAEKGGHASKSAIYAKAIRQLQNDGFVVEWCFITSTPQ